MTRWNIFARELEDILAVRGLGLGHLDDRASIHREKVRRLRYSVNNPESLPVLNPDEMDDVISEFRLNYDEVIRLRAAILATGIENMLMKRIDPGNALIAAEQVFPHVLAAFRQSLGRSRGLAMMKGDNANSIKGNTLNAFLGATWDALDEGTIFLHLSYNVASLKEAVDYVQKALTAFETALQEIEDVRDEIEEINRWQVWYEDAQKGITNAKQRLAELAS